MGILDDAIKEHLDLKRRQGVEDSELARLEDEAFGPPSRPGDPDFPQDTPEAAAETAVAEPPSSEGLAAPEPFVQEAGAPPASEPDLELDLDLEEEPAVEPDPTPVPAEPPIESLDTVEHKPDFEPPIESLDTVEHHFEGAIEDTGEAEAVEGPIEDTGEVEVVEGELELEEDDGEDVLEETPEFLRDQPEDDELWFEQGEPKDFDF
jgi:hypothetical protein